MTPPGPLGAKMTEEMAKSRISAPLNGPWRGSGGGLEGVWRGGFFSQTGVQLEDLGGFGPFGPVQGLYRG